MSAGVLIEARTLRSCFEDLRPLFGKGNNLIPVLFKIKDNRLTVCCTSGCIYLNKLVITNDENISSEITAQYRNMIDFIPTSGLLRVSIESYGLIISGEGTEIKLPVGFSLITEPEQKQLQFTHVESQNFRIGISSLLNVGLASIYKAEKPINIYGNISTLKYPNVIMQARTPGLPVAVSLTQDFAKLVTRFSPDAIYTNNIDTLVLKRDEAYLEIPAEPLHDENDFLKHMVGLSEPLRLDIEHYADRLRNMNSLGNSVRAKVTFYNNGVRVTAEQDNVAIATDLGSCEGDLKKVLYFPMLLYLSMIKALGNTTVEFLYGKEIICLRSPSLIIIARAII